MMLLLDFETHVMPRLAKEYTQAGNKMVPFDLEKIENIELRIFPGLDESIRTRRTTRKTEKNKKF